MRSPRLLAGLLLPLAACAHVPHRARPEPVGSLAEARPAPRDDRVRTRDLHPEDSLLQGFFGASLFEHVERTGGVDEPEYVDEPDLDTLPLIGGGGQWVLGGGAIDLGVEAGLSFGFRTSGAAFVSGGNGAIVAVDVNLLLIDVYGGFFASTFLGDRWRLYAAAGPLMEFADYEQDSDLVESGNGFGVGYYGRAGLEYVLASRTMIGLGARWQESEIDLSDGLGDLDVRGTQVYVTVTTGL